MLKAEEVVSEENMFVNCSQVIHKGGRRGQRGARRMQTENGEDHHR